MTPFRVGAALMAAAVLTLSACSSDPSDSDESKNKNDEVSGELATQLPAATGDIDELNWAVPAGEPPQLDPRNAASQSMALFTANLCDPIVSSDANYGISPNLVTYEQVDPLTLHFTMNPDASEATFWNGNPVTIEDVAYSLQRTMDPNAVFSFYYANVKSVEQIDDQTVEVKFTQPDELFLKEMAGGAGMVVDRTVAEAQGDKFGTSDGELMCSGPFKLKTWTPGSSIVLERNEDYWNSEFRPFAKVVNFSFLTDSSALTQALNSGEVDGAYEVPPAVIPTLQKSSEGKIHYGTGPLAYFLGWAQPDGPLADIKLRKALYIATDREALAEKVFNGAAQAAYTLVWSGTWDVDQRDKYSEAEKTYREINKYDLDAAKRLVEESSYDGQELVMTIQTGDETMSLVAQYIQQQAKQIGVTVKINPVQAVDYTTQTYDAEARKGTDILIGPTYNGYPDPLEGIGYIFEKDGVYNWSGFDDPKVNKLLGQARGTFDSAERVDLVLEAQEIYEPEYPEPSLVSLYEVSFLSDELTGMVTTTAYQRTPSMALIGAK